MQVKNIVSRVKCKVIIETEDGSTTYIPGQKELDELIKNYLVDEISAPQTDVIHIRAKKNNAPSLEEAGYTFEAGMGME